MLDSKVGVDPPQLLVLACEPGDLDRVDVVLQWGQVKQGRARVRRRISAGDEPDLEVRDPPLAQLGVGVGDEDDRMVLSRHSCPGSWNLMVPACREEQSDLT